MSYSIFSTHSHRDRPLREIPGYTVKKRRRLLPWLTKRRGLVIVAVACVVGAYLVIQSRHDQSVPTNGGDVSSTSRPQLKTNQTPSFDTLTPHGAAITQYGGWTLVSPDKNAPTYAYHDTIEGVAIIVSEQQLPSSFTGDVDKKLSSFAASFSASQKIKVGTRTAYVSTAKSGSQMLVYATDTLLIFIRSTSKVSDAVWANYLGSLS